MVLVRVACISFSPIFLTHRKKIIFVAIVNHYKNFGTKFLGQALFAKGKEKYSQWKKSLRQVLFNNNL